MNSNGFYKVNGAEERQDSVTRIGDKNYLLIFGYGKDADSDTGWNWRKNYDHAPSKAELKADIDALINAETDATILTGYKYDGSAVWLSTENQFNYKAAYDLAVQSDGATLPVTIKIGTEEQPVYKTFDTVTAFAEFYTGALSHVQTALEEGWREKDDVDYDKLVQYE